MPRDQALRYPALTCDLHSLSHVRMVAVCTGVATLFDVLVTDWTCGQTCHEYPGNRGSYLSDTLSRHCAPHHTCRTDSHTSAGEEMSVIVLHNVFQHVRTV